MPCLLLFGMTGMGKTRILQEFIRDHDSHYEASAGRTRLPVASFQMPPAPRERDFYEELIVSLGGVLVDGGLSLTTSTSSQEEFQLWHAPQTYWPVADRTLQVVKTFRSERKQRLALTPAHSPTKKKRTKEEVREESTNYYASNLELGSVPPTFIHQLGRSRWRVDTETFQTLTTQAHLKQPSVHRTTALVVLTLIRVLAYTLSTVFYHRQVVSHSRPTPPTFSEMARLLGYLFLLPGLDSS
jgi:hypothetical protein